MCVIYKLVNTRFFVTQDCLLVATVNELPLSLNEKPLSLNEILRKDDTIFIYLCTAFSGWN